MAPWPDEFEKVVRQNLPHLGVDDELDQDKPLAEYGLDSMATVTLLVELESALAVEFPDELLVPETFETASRLWEATCAVRP